MRKMGLVALSATLVAACGQMDRLEEVAATAEPLNQTVYPKDLADFYQLGQGRDVVREEVRSQCLAATSPTVPANMPASTMRFDQSVLVQEVTSKLGFDATLKSHFKILDVDAKAKMARATQTNRVSRSQSVALFSSRISRTQLVAREGFSFSAASSWSSRVMKPVLAMWVSIQA